MTPDHPEWFSNVKAPLSLRDGDDLDWHGKADLLVVGFGGAGAAAALQALELGQIVIAFDRFAGGGATRASGGVLYAGGGTHIQKAAGQDDDADNMFNYLKQEVGEIVSDAGLRDFCGRSAETVDWLTEYGVDFRADYWPQKTSYPGVDYFLYHPDNSLVADYAAKARPAARGHRGYVPPEEGIKATNLGGPIFDPMKQAIKSKGGEIRVQSEVLQLIINADGRVIGLATEEFTPDTPEAVEHKNLLEKAAALRGKFPPSLPGAGVFLKRAKRYEDKAIELQQTCRKTRYFRADKGVVICAGGFIFNPDMIALYAPKYQDAFPLGTAGDNGAGIRLGQSVGAAIGNMDRLSPWRFINPPHAWATGIVVNEHGERFIDETSYGATLGVHMVEDQGGKAWLILDRTQYKAALNEVKGRKVLPFQRDLTRLNSWFAAKKARNLPALAQKIGISPEGLEATIADYNKAASGAAPDTLSKPAKDISAIETGPFYAINIGLDASLFPCSSITLGGLLVDEVTGQVKSETGAHVPGLFAAGRAAVGICSWKYVSGLSIADCIYSGRRVGRSIASWR